ncbi:MAG TPA: TerC/Alx family metal homeostasis membrane protein [Acidobacteriaceae bacterium]
MIAGASFSFWISFHAVVAGLLFVDLVLLQGSRRVSLRTAWSWTAIVAAAAFCFAIFLSHTQGPEHGLEFLSGYLVEGSLSVDNLFVFLLLFRSLQLDVEQQRRVLLWGVLGAIVLRALCIFVGVALLARFAFVEVIFGALLLAAGVRLLRSKPHDAAHAQPGPLRWLSRRMQTGPGARPPASAFLLIILAVEATDLIFALDSIPAVLAISRNPFLVYTSNIFAILGLRSLYFALAGVLDKLRLLHYGLALILIFVAFKMLAARWVHVPTPVSLGVILAILLVFTVASKVMPQPSPPARP